MQLLAADCAHALFFSPRASKRAREDEDGLERYLRDLGHRGSDTGPAVKFDDIPTLFPEGDALPYQLTELPSRQAPQYSTCFAVRLRMAQPV